jgi:hypothetical protein
MDDSFVFNGRFRKDTFGNVVVDTCESDDKHLVGAITDPKIGKPSCRKSINVFDEIIGKSGHLMVYVQFEECDPDCTEDF